MEKIGEILIGKDYKLTADSLNIYLSLRKIHRKTGVERWKTTNFFATIKEALHFLVDQGIRDSGLKELDKKIDGLHQMIEDIKIPTQYIEKRIPTPQPQPSPEALSPALWRFRRRTIAKHK